MACFGVISGFMEKRGLQAPLRAAFQYSKGAYKKAGKGLLTRACSRQGLIALN